MARNSKNKKIHMLLISALVNKLMSEGYKVSADHIGYPNGIPLAWEGYIPDIYAVKDGKEFFIEAETSDTLDSTKTRIEWTALSSKPNVTFSIIVPERCLDKAKELEKKWNIKIKDFWTMKV